MTSNVVVMVILSASVAFVMVIAIVVILLARMKKIRADQALVILRPTGGPMVAFSPRLVAPLQTAEVIELGTRVVVVRDTLPARDGTLLAVEARFELAIEPTEDSVLRVAREMGVAKANDPRAVEARFAPHFAQVLRAVIAQIRPNELEAERLNVVAKVIAEASSDLGGFVVRNVVLTSVEPASEHPEVAVSLAKQLAEHGVMDVRFGSEVACDVPVDAASFSVHAQDLARHLPPTLTMGDVAAIGDATVTVADGRATVKWSSSHVADDAFAAGARLVHSLRTTGLR